MKKGFVIGGILIAVGLVLQATAGPVCWDSLAYPVNLTVLIAFLVLLVTAWLLRNKVYLFSWMMHLGAAVAAMSYAIALTVVMGLVAQRDDGAGDKYAIDAKHIWITAAGGGLVQSIGPDGSAVTGAIDVILDDAVPNPFFVALRNNNTTDDEALAFRVMDSEGITYYGTKTIPAAYKPNGTFVSMKNATLTERLGVTLNTGTGITVENAM